MFSWICLFSSFIKAETAVLNDEFGTHYVVSAYLIKLKEKPNFVLDEQHEILEFFNLDELKTNDKIHKYTRNYSEYIFTI